MYINVENFQLTVNEKEMFIFAFALRDKCLSIAEHCSNHNGMDTFWVNCKKEAKMLEEICNRLDRINIYSDMLKDLERNIEKHQQETETK